MNHFELEMLMREHQREMRTKTQELRLLRLPIMDWLVGASGALILAGL
ncbi:hypothetical protein PM3016_1923 [Paenibacillus mucilaginosus 3016]|uniref:Uncharacterized protein n=1 Tax=Paenibacillus mucilaginosus 3016 TaxID=1116391 RepID=H6NJ65_9BACL|nr:hypothetical protein [Paenibacillus mucilaginosus]AFC28827.1 hypothetical protein PM3016_1923 [Paenibacillus mucilaginosus 3016]